MLSFLPKLAKRNKLLVGGKEIPARDASLKRPIDTKVDAIARAKLEHELLEPQEYFTADVVYPWFVLFEATLEEPDVHRNYKRMSQSEQFEEYFPRVLKTYDLHENDFGVAVIWNARKQTLQAFYGITNTTLTSRCRNSDVTLAAIKNAFTMLNYDAQDADPANQRRRFQGNFTPAFYPARYIMKDPMYEQYPYVIDRLLLYARDLYKEQAVEYVELSVSARDLLNNPTIQQRLLSPLDFTSWDGTPTKFPRRTMLDIDTVVDINYLAMIPRNLEPYPWSLADTDVYKGKKEEMLALLETPNAPFWNSARNLLDTARSAAGTNNARLQKKWVGLDWASDELYFPLCPFHQGAFMEFLAQQRERTQGNFGFRIHGGENFPDEFRQVHLEMVAHTFVKMIDWVRAKDQNGRFRGKK